ncbi:hypothetical protein GJ496_005689 [Pomphorhynchus laevis]|nr:hypothetical protein GJ496_005689 [Pomphorhynchus laevis]
MCDNVDNFNIISDGKQYLDYYHEISSNRHFPFILLTYSRSEINVSSTEYHREYDIFVCNNRVCLHFLNWLLC